MIAVDVGGTFTDVVATEKGTVNVAKVPTRPEETASSVLEGAQAVDVKNKATFNHASTIGLNAVLTRNLPKIAFLTTGGHRDILDMARVWRPVEAMSDLHWRRSFGDAARPLIPRYLRREIKERMKSDGSVMIPLDEVQAREQLQILKKCDVEGLAICLLNAYVNPEHEVRLKKLAEDVLGDVPCSISSDVSPLAKEYARASTTVIDVFMKMVFGDYLKDLVSGLRDQGFAGQINLADCAAMLEPAESAMNRPFRIMYSGPAAGTMSSAYFGKLIGEENLICCDIGGTSTDISLVMEGTPFVNTTFEIEHDLVVNTLANEIHTLGAGGGSIVALGPGGHLRVGPESAGGDPGPACYGRGGTNPTVSDACLLIGILDENKFLGGEFKLHRDLAMQAFEQLETALPLGERVRYAYDLARNNIAEGLIDILVRHGVDPRDYSLISYGSAGGMLLTGIMGQVGVKRIIVPPHPGQFSALGLLSSDLVYTANRSAYMMLSPEAAEKIDAIYEPMEADLRKGLPSNADVVVTRTFDGHLAGQSWETPFIEVPPGKITGETVQGLIQSFHEAYEKRWGNKFDFMPVVSANYRAQAIVTVDKIQYPELERRKSGQPVPEGQVTLRYLTTDGVAMDEYRRENLLWGDVIQGPAIIREAVSTVLVSSRQNATVGPHGELVIERKV